MNSFEGFFEEKTLLADSIFDDVLKFLKERVEIGDKIFISHIFLQFKCGNYASRLIMKRLEESGYVSTIQFESGNTHE